MQPANTFLNNKRVMLPVVVVVVAIVLLAAGSINVLLHRMDDAIEENGKTSMQAVVEQLQQSYELQVENYYSRLRIIQSYTSQDSSVLLTDDNFRHLVNTLEDETSWKVIFIRDNGSSMGINGKERRLDIPSSILADLANNQNIAKLISYNDGQTTKSKFLLAIPCPAYEINGQTFTAVGALIDREEIDSVLKLYAYSGDAFLFLLNADGDVLYTNQSDEKLFQNYSLLKHLKQDSALTADEADSLQQSFAERSIGVRLFNGDQALYLGYAPIQNNGATLVCIASKGTVDNTLSSYQKTVLYSTMAMATALLLLIAALFFSLWKVNVARQKAAFEKQNIKRERQNSKRLEILNTELESAQSVTAQALQNAKAANAAKTNFLANMSHDIRTPLNAIIGLAALIDHDAGNEARVREYVRRVQLSSENLLAIINEVLDMNKIESGKTTLNCEDFSILEFVSNVEDMFRPQTDARRQTFEVITKNIQHEHLNGDDVRLAQIASNLLSNAAKYTQTGGTVQFVVEERPARSASYAKFRFQVIDNGIGMDKEFQDKIFDAFTREESSLTNKIQGTGLGMAITKSLVEIMGGSISVTSEKGRGSCFEVLLEMKIAQRGGATAKQDDARDEKSATSLEGMRFLCAEDNALNAEILTELLHIEGAQCVICENGKKVVAAFERSKPGDFDMILMDVQMPVMNGYEAARAIRTSSHERATSVPIIAMTANAFSEDIQASLAAGMNAHVSKPIDMEVLKKEVGRVLAEAAE